MKCIECKTDISFLGNYGSDSTPLCFKCSKRQEKERDLKNSPKKNIRPQTKREAIQNKEYLYLLAFTVLTTLNTILIAGFQLYGGDDGSLAISIPFFHIPLFWCTNYLLNQPLLKADKEYIHIQFPELYKWLWGGMYRSGFRIIEFIAGERDDGSDQGLQQAKRNLRNYIFIAIIPFPIVIWNVIVFVAALSITGRLYLK